jgi:hypothetical protein
MDFNGGIHFQIGTIKIHTLAHATANALGKFSILFLMNGRNTFPVNFKFLLPFEEYQKSNSSKTRKHPAIERETNFVQGMQFKKGH